MFETLPRSLAGVVVLALAVAACDGDGDDGDDDEATGDTSEPAATAPTTTASSTTTPAATTPGTAAPTSTAPGTTALSTTAPVTTASGTEVADRGAELRYSPNSSFNSLDPHRGAGGGDALYMRPIYDRLVTGTSAGGEWRIEPELATSYEFADDGMSIEFELRDGVMFQDGTPFNADAVKANIERGKSPDSTVSSQLANVESVEVVDDTHVVFRLTRLDPSILWNLAVDTTGMMASPAAFGGDLSANPIGSGPFTLVSALKDADVVYERWDDHWDPDAAQVERLVITLVSDTNARFNAIRTGELDIAYLGPAQIPEAEPLESDGYELDWQYGPQNYEIALNSDLPPFDDVRVRRAVHLAINRTEISEELLDGVYPPAFQAFPEGILGHDPALNADPFDPEGAKALVSEAGAEGATIMIIQQASPPQDSIALVVQQALSDIGLDAQVVPFSTTEARAAWREGGHHAFVAANAGRADPQPTLQRAFLGIDNPAESKPTELIDMANAALSLPLGSSEREGAYRAISAYLIENPVNVPIAQFTTVQLCRPNVIGCETLGNYSLLDFRGIGIATT